VAWPFDPSVYGGLALLLLAYAALARGREDVGTGRPVAFLAGVVVLWTALETPIDTLSDYYLQSVHMLQHVLLGVVAPPLLVLGISPSMAGLIARVPGWRLVSEPVPAQLIAAAVMIGWHVPYLYDLTLQVDGIHVFEHLTFIAAGVLFWWPVAGPTGATTRWQLSEAGKLAYLLIGTLPQDGVALVLQFSRVLFYGYYAHVPQIVPGWDPVIDQNVAGAVLQVIGKTSFLIAGIVLFYQWVAREQEGGDPADLLSFR
jgi:putative membrane protein